LLKLRRDLVDALVRCKVNKFSLLARMTCAAGHVEESDLLLPPGQGAHEVGLYKSKCN
jgi:sn1-specific diacylglycerol lipase